MFTQEDETYLAVLIAVSFLALILIFFIINLMFNQKKIRRLQKTLISAEIITLEKERKRFSQDLHDDIGPNLSAVLLYCNILQPVGEENTKALVKIEEILNLTLAQIREISRNITPQCLTEQGLKKSLEIMVKNFNQAIQDKTRIVLNIDSLPTHLNEIENLNVYRIVQEAINNAIKHASPSEIRVHISVIGFKTTVLISDNGSGFEYTGMGNNPKSETGIGLINIQNRVIFLGGQLNIYSQLGKGTKIVAEIPIR